MKADRPQESIGGLLCRQRGCGFPPIPPRRHQQLTCAANLSLPVSPSGRSFRRTIQPGITRRATWLCPSGTSWRLNRSIDRYWASQNPCSSIPPAGGTTNDMFGPRMKKGRSDDWFRPAYTSCVRSRLQTSDDAVQVRKHPSDQAMRESLAREQR